MTTEISLPPNDTKTCSSPAAPQSAQDHFFSDPEAFDVLTAQVLPQLLATKAANDTVRVWVPGCGSGEDTYTLALLLQEGLERAGKRCQVQIFATDSDPHAIEVARRGEYPAARAIDSSPDRLHRFFMRAGTSCRIVNELRAMVIFGMRNLFVDPPLTKMDLLFCRNLLRPLDASQQKHLLSMLHYALRPGGFLLLDTFEMRSGFDNLFAVVGKHWQLFQNRYGAEPVPLMPVTRLEALVDKLSEAAARMDCGPLTQVTTTEGV